MACASLAHDAAALEALEAEFLAAVPRAVARVDSSESFGAEVKAAVRSHLLVGVSGQGAIARYAGRGPLGSFIQVSALRIALRWRKKTRPTVDLADVEPLLGTPDPHLAFVKARARDDFRRAFASALAELSPAERYLLRLHYLDGLSLAQIGAAEQVDKSTISRRLTAIRQTLLDETYRLLRSQLQLDDSEVASLMGIIASQLDVSMEALLRSR